MPHLEEFVPYRCVAPRDLFNQAKLLKCLGKLCVMHLDKKYKALQLVTVIEPAPGEGYVIGQDQGSGDIACTTLRFELRGEPLVLFTTLNSRADWPLEFWDPAEDTGYDVFTGKGNFVGLSLEFITFLGG